jgi:hypothetical protein
MTFEEFLGKVSDARKARQTAMEKVRTAMEELAAANDQMDQALALMPARSSEADIDAFDFAQMNRNLFEEMFGPAKAIGRPFNFGDLF